MKLKGKVAVITGSGTGLGRCCAELFAKEGAKIVVADISKETGQETVSIIKKAGGEATFTCVDVTRASDCQNMVKTAVDTYGKLDIMFNNAGISGGFGFIADRTEENWNQVMAVNLHGVFLCTKYAVQQMIKQGGGVIVTTASTAGKDVTAGMGPYGVSKAGVIYLTKMAAVEYAKHNIRANLVLPYAMETPFWSGMDKTQADAMLKMTASASPFGRLPKVEEVARVALFLASDESSYVNGVAIPVDAGRHP